MESVEFGKYLKKLRADKGLTIRQVELYSGVSNAYLSQLENGKRGIPSPDILKKLFECLDVPYEVLMKKAGYLKEENVDIKKAQEQYKNYKQNQEEIDKPLNEAIFQIIDSRTKDGKLDDLLNAVVKRFLAHSSTSFTQENLTDPQFAKNLFLHLPSNRKIDFLEKLVDVGLENKPTKRVKLPIIGTVKAGQNGIAYEEHLGMEWVDEDDVNGGQYIWLKVKGDSMIGEGIHPGDLALVRIQPELENGDLAVVIVNGEEGTLKRIYKKENSIVLQASNPNYPPRIFTGKELENIRVVGKVKETKRKY